MAGKYVWCMSAKQGHMLCTFSIWTYSSHVIVKSIVYMIISPKMPGDIWSAIAKSRLKDPNLLGLLVSTPQNDPVQARSGIRRKTFADNFPKASQSLPPLLWYQIKHKLVAQKRGYLCSNYMFLLIVTYSGNLLRPILPSAICFSNGREHSTSSLPLLSVQFLPMIHIRRISWGSSRRSRSICLRAPALEPSSTFSKENKINHVFLITSKGSKLYKQMKGNTPRSAC